MTGTLHVSDEVRRSALDALTDLERRLIGKCVYSLECLVSGQVDPQTPAQVHFKSACLLECDPETKYEEAFINYVDNVNRILKESSPDNFRSSGDYKGRFGSEHRHQKVLPVAPKVFKTPKKYTPPAFSEDRTELDWGRDVRKQSGSFCSICNGDGGINGECWKCGGTGFSKNY